MTDRLIIFDERLTGRLSLDPDSGEIASTDGLETAVTISLFSDKRAPADAILPDNSGDRRGWCLTFRQRQADADADEIGSWLWLLSREKQLPEVVAKAKYYAEDSLAWLVRRRIAAKVVVTAEIAAPEVLGLLVEVTRRDGSVWTATYRYYWTRHAG